MMMDLKTTFHRFKHYQHWIWWLLGLALGLRLFHLGAWSFWHDEALTVLLARKPIADLIAITAADVHPPLYFLLVKLFLHAGQSEFWVRLPSALCSTGAVMALYLIGRDLFSKQTGLISAFIMSLSPLQLFYAQEARMYAQLLLLTGFCTWAFIRALQDNGNRWWSLFIVSATLASYTAYFSFPLFLAMGLYILLLKRSRKQLVRFGLSMLGVAGLYLPWLTIFFSQARSVLAAYWIETPHLLTLLTTMSGFFVGVFLPDFGIAVSLAATLFIILVVLNNVRHALAHKSEESPALIWLLLWLFVPLLGTYLISLVRPIFQLRTVIIAALPIYLLIGWGLTRIPHKSINLWLFLPTLVVMLMSTYNFYFNPDYAKPPWREAATYVREHAQVDEVGIHASDGSFLPFLAYEHNIQHILLPGDPEIARINAPSQAIVTAVTAPQKGIAEAVRGYRRVWLVLGFDQAIAYQLAQKKYFDQHYHLLNETQLGGIVILRYVLDE